MAAELKFPQEHSAALVSSWRGPAKLSALRAARPAGPGIIEHTDHVGRPRILLQPILRD